MKKIINITLSVCSCFSAILWYGCKDKIELPGELYGVVTDKATGEPITAAGVELQPVGLKTVTGTDGQYGFNELDPGKYKLCITKTGYADCLSNEIVVKSEQIAHGDVQLEKLPPALKIVNSAGNEVDTLYFGDAESDVMRSFNIFNDGSESLQWQISKTAKWIEAFSVESGKLLPGATQAVVITIDRNLLDEKQNATTIQITSNNGSKELLVLAMNNREAIVVNVEGATNVTASTAIFHGKMVNYGNPSITERGFVYTTESVATLENTIEKLTVAVNEQKEYSIQVRNLELGKTYNVRAYASNILGLVYSSNSVSVHPEASLPVVETDDITSVNIAEGKAIFNGNVFESGDPVYTEKGFAYGTVPNPTVDDLKKVVSVNGTGKFSANINGLEEGKVYHVRAYAINVNGTAYGTNKKIDFTAKMPVVSTKDVTNIRIAQGMATFTGFIDSLGDLGYTERGFVYAETHNPSIDDFKRVVSGAGLGDYSLNISDLEEGKHYYIRAYLTNTKGTVYGQEVSLDFTAKMPEVETMETSEKNIALGMVKFNGNIASTGDLPLVECGFVYAISHNPTIDDIKVLSSGHEAGLYSANASNIEEGKVYYIRSYASNRKGVVYGKEVVLDFNAQMPVVQTKESSNINRGNGTAMFNATIVTMGDLPYTERGFVYADVHNPTVENDFKVVSIGSGSGDYTANASNLTVGKFYYIRAYVSNAKGTTYGSESILDFKAVLPIVTTNDVVKVDETSAVFNGTITSIGDPIYTERGFVYGTIPVPTIDNPSVEVKSVVGNAAGAYNLTITGLIEDETYYVRAYVKSKDDVIYGEISSFVAEHPLYIKLPEDGLMVQREDLGVTNLATALSMCKNSNVGGFTDWKLPSIEELTILYNARDKIGNFQAANYWTCNGKAVSDYETYYYFMDFINGIISYVTSPYKTFRVRAVRPMNK